MFAEPGSSTGPAHWAAAPVKPDGGEPDLIVREVLDNSADAATDLGTGTVKTGSYLHVVVKDQLERRNMSIRDLARTIGATPTVVSRWVTADPQRRVVPESKGCVQLAQALGLDAIEVLVAAGRIPPLDGRPPHPHESEIKRMTLGLELTLRRVPSAAWPTFRRIVDVFLNSISHAAQEATLDEVSGRGRTTEE